MSICIFQLMPISHYEIRGFSHLHYSSYGVLLIFLSYQYPLKSYEILSYFPLFFCSERSWLDQGHKVGERIIPLARNFSNASMDLESGSNSKVCINS